MNRGTAKIALAAALGLSLACSAGMAMEESGGAGGGPPGAGGGGAGGGMGGCGSNEDCPAGLICTAGVCVSPDDGRPPEVEADHSFLRPVASPHFVFALSPQADSAAVIDPVTLGIEAVILPDEPVAAAVIPGTDGAVILSRAGEALSLLSRDAGGWQLVTARTRRRFDALSLSPDGKTAVLWTPEGTTPDVGAEGIVAFVDLAQLAAGGELFPIERAAGRRLTDVIFRDDGSGTRDAVIVGKEEVAIFDLATLATTPAPARIRLPPGYQEILTREAIGAPDGSFVLFRSYGGPEVAILDVAARAVSTLPLPAVATDLELSSDGSLAVVALRSTGQVAWFPLPEAIADPSRLTVVDAPGVIPGQVAISGDGGFAVLFTTTEDSERFGYVDLQAAAPEVLVFDFLEKWVQGVGIAPDGETAVVIHRPNPASTVADLYERSVDTQHGYSIVDLRQGFAQLKLTGTVKPEEFVFAADGRHAAVTLRDDASHVYRVDAVDLGTLVADSLDLASAPEYAGALTSDEAALSGRIWVTQVHPAGRISFIDLEERSVRTATGYELNSDIE